MHTNFDRWMEKSVAHLASHEAQLDSPDLMRSVEELTRDLSERMRNLFPVDPKVPRGQEWPKAVLDILEHRELPPEYRDSAVWRGAHQLFWQIAALNKVPGAQLWHPV